MLAIQKTNTELVFGAQDDLEAFAARIKLMTKGGDKLSPNEALALAQVASVTHLNPFIGEVWYIPGKGPMIGIAGARRVDQEETKSRGGHSWPIVTPVSPEEAGALEFEAKDVVAAFKVEINDSAATAEYQKMFTATLEALRDMGVPDPFAAAKEVCGPRPVWTGYGFSKKTDQSTMNKTQLARKRAEADGLKKRILIPFGAQVAETDIAPDYVDAQARDVPSGRTEADNMRELGFGDGDVDKDFPPESKAMPRPAESVGSITYEEAQKVIVEVKNRKVKIGDMTKEQLDWVIAKSLIQANADAAQIVLRHDYQMEPEGNKPPEGQLL